MRETSTHFLIASRENTLGCEVFREANAEASPKCGENAGFARYRDESDGGACLPVIRVVPRESCSSLWG